MKHVFGVIILSVAIPLMPVLAQTQATHDRGHTSALNAKILNSSVLKRPAVNLTPLPPTPMAHSAAHNLQALNIAPRRDTAKALTVARVPSLLGAPRPRVRFSSASLFAPQRVELNAFRDFSVRGLTSSTFESSKTPNMHNSQ